MSKKTELAEDVKNTVTEWVRRVGLVNFTPLGGAVGFREYIMPRVGSRLGEIVTRHRLRMDRLIPQFQAELRELAERTAKTEVDRIYKQLAQDRAMRTTSSGGYWLENTSANYVATGWRTS